MNMEHLNERVRPLLNLDNAERIKCIYADRWIGYPKADELLRAIETHFDRPRVARTRHILIVAKTNNGKSSLLRRFYSMHRPDPNVLDEKVRLPVMFIDMPPAPDERGLYLEIMRVLGEPVPRQIGLARLRNDTLSLLESLSVRMILIDEFHHLVAGDARRKEGCLNALKCIGNKLGITIVGAGTKEAYPAIQSIDQVANRFLPYVMPRWELDEDFRQLLSAFESVLPLAQPSRLAYDKKLGNRLLTLCEGTIGELSDLLNEAAEKAIRIGAEAITDRVLDKLDWTPASVRPSKGANQVD